MATRELREVLRLIDKVLTDRRVDEGQRDRLLRARRELVKHGNGGKADRVRVLRATRLISEVLLEIVVKEVGLRPR